jgi:hypothetical protein
MWMATSLIMATQLKYSYCADAMSSDLNQALALASSVSLSLMPTSYGFIPLASIDLPLPSLVFLFAQESKTSVHADSAEQSGPVAF